MRAVQIELSEDARDFQRRNWSALVHEDPAGSFFHQPPFLKLYWEEFGDEAISLLLGLRQEPTATRSARSAFERHGDTLRFLGGTEITDYLGPVASPAHRRARSPRRCGTRCSRATTGPRADLWGLRGRRRMVRPARARPRPSADFSVEERRPRRRRADPRAARNVGCLPRGAAGQAPPRDPAEGQEARVRGGPFRIVTAGTEDLATLLDRFVELHRLSEGPKGVFMVPGMEIFFRRLGEAFLSSGAFRLNFIEVNGELAAGTIGFRWGDQSYLYNSAFDRSWGSLAPGMVLVGEDIRLAIEDGASGFDLLKGDYAYKYRFGATPRTVRRMVVRPKRLGVGADRSQDELAEFDVAADDERTRRERLLRIEAAAGDERHLRRAADDRWRRASRRAAAPRRRRGPSATCPRRRR